MGDGTLGGFWEHEQFRSAVRLLAGLNERAFNTIDDLIIPLRETPSRYTVSALSERLDLSSDDAVLLAAGLRSMHQLGQNAPGGIAEVVDELERAFDSIDDAATADALRTNKASLVESLAAGDASSVRELRQIVGQAIVPSLERSQASVDMRVLQGFGEETFSLVPSILLRFELDEPLAGSSAQFFQASPVAIRALHGELELALRQLDSVTEALSEWVL